MTESKTLLSQNEIDALIFFLERHEDTQIGKVLDQSSIDKLVDIVKSYNSRGIFLKKDAQLDMDGKVKAVITDGNGEVVDASRCELLLDFDDKQNIKVYCVKNDDKEIYPMFPETLTKKNYVTEGSAWGVAIAPSTLYRLSELFEVKVSSETLGVARKSFAKAVYGNEEMALPEYYEKQS